MNQCRLCKNAKADMKNAHLIPHFLIKTATNEDGSPLRDKELIFSISSSDFVDIFYGRNISIDKISEVRGRDLTDEEIQALSNPITVDELICRSCEKKIALVESYIADSLYNPMLTGNIVVAGKDYKGAQISEWKGVDSSLFYLFVYSIFWRCSAAKLDGFSLTPDIEEELRLILTTNLKDDLGQMMGLDSTSIGKFPIVSTFSEDGTGIDPTADFITLHNTRFPYFLIANRMTFQLFEKVKQVKNSQFYLNGLSSMVDAVQSLMHLNSQVKIALIDKKQSEILKVHTYEEIGKKFNNFQKGSIQEIHQRTFGRRAPIEFLQIFFTKFHSGEMPIGKRYSKEYFAECLEFAFLRYGYK